MIFSGKIRKNRKSSEKYFVGKFFRKLRKNTKKIGKILWKIRKNSLEKNKKLEKIEKIPKNRKKSEK